MKSRKAFFVWILILLVSVEVNFGQTTENDGDWSAKHLVLKSTPQAQLMVRTGDIDNLNFGWPVGYDPFTGELSQNHTFPFTPDPIDPPGTDKVLVISSYTGSDMPCGSDGYANTSSRPDNNVVPIELHYNLGGIIIKSAILQIFADDFQASVWCASYEVTIDNIRVPFLESIINSLTQSGPVGKILTVPIPENYLYLLEDGELSIKFDDSTTKAGEGYAIDFIKLLINPKSTGQYATIVGTVVDTITSSPIEGVRVVANGLDTAYTNASGNYKLDYVNPGLIVVRTDKEGFGAQIKTINLAQDELDTLNFYLKHSAPKIISVYPQNQSMVSDLYTVVKVSFNEPMDQSTFNLSNFILSDYNGAVSGIFSKNDTGFVFLLDNPLKSITKYTATLTTGIKNIIGTNLENDFTWTFTSTSQDLQDTIDLAVNGDTIVVKRGIHHGRGDKYIDPTCGNCPVPNFNIQTTKGFIIKDKTIHLVGESLEGSIIQTDAGYGVIFQNANGSTIKNLTITGGKNSADSNATDAAIVIRNSTAIIIDSIKIHRNNSPSVPGIGGIALREGAEATIQNCTIENNSWDGITLYHGTIYGNKPMASIKNNIIRNTKANEYGKGTGISLNYDAEAIISNNKISKMWKGIGVHLNSTAEAYNNIIEYQMGWGVYCDTNSVIKLKNNVIYKNNRTGFISFSIGSQSSIVNNVIVENGKGSFGDNGELWWSAGIYFSNYPPTCKFENNDSWGNKNSNNVESGNLGKVDFESINGNISKNPQFKNPTISDYWIECNSFLINAGSPSITDLNSTISDMGIYGGPFSTIEPPDCPIVSSNETIAGISFSSHSNPNPFSDYTCINYTLIKPSDVGLKIFNSLGQEVYSIPIQKQQSGDQTIIWNGKNNNDNKLRAGVYFYSLQIDNQIYSNKIILSY